MRLTERPFVDPVPVSAFPKAFASLTLIKQFRVMLRLMNAILPITAKSITRRESAFHPSAEQYRARANLLKSSIGPAIGGPERAALLDMAMEFERLAAELERMRTRNAKPGPDLPPEVRPCRWADRLVRRFGDLKRRMTKTKTSG